MFTIKHSCIESWSFVMRTSSSFSCFSLSLSSSFLIEHVSSFVCLFCKCKHLFRTYFRSWLVLEEKKSKVYRLTQVTLVICQSAKELILVRIIYASQRMTIVVRSIRWKLKINRKRDDKSCCFHILDLKLVWYEYGSMNWNISLNIVDE